MTPGVVVLGASRSGTSMTAGLFAAHGVWFGDCMPASAINPKGFFENLALKRVWGGDRPGDFPAWWRDERRANGCTGPWGAKSGAECWDLWRGVRDIACVVLCYRDRDSIAESRARAGFGRAPAATARNWRIMERVRKQALVPVVSVWTPRLVDGDCAEIVPAFEALGVPFDAAVASAWLEPDLWHHRPR